MAEPKVRFRRDDGSSYPAWNDVVLGDIATRVTRKNANGETDRPLTIASIEGLVDQRTYFGKTIASKDMSGYFLLKNGEYAYNKSYSAGYDYGSIKRLDKYDMGALSTLYICFALNKDQNTDFYDCYFDGLSWYSQMPQICAEGARNHGLLNVSPNDFFKIQLSVPSSKEEQQKIADFLSSVDDVITASEEEVANLETQKKAVMKKLFSQEVRFKRADGSDFPKWEEKPLECIIKVIIDNRGKTPPLSKSGYPLIEISAVGDYYLRYEKIEKWVNQETYDNWFRKHLENGDLLFSTVGNTAQCTVYDEKEKCCVAQNIIGIRFDENTDSRFMFNVLTYEQNQKLIKSIQMNGVQPSVKVSQLIKLSFSIASLEEQRLIADFLSNFDEAIAAAKKELELWKELKKGLLQQMFV